MLVSHARGSALTACLSVVLGAAGAAWAGEPPQNQEVFIRTHGALGESRAPSVRSRGMGGAWAALANGAGSVQENPAALGAFTGNSVGGGLAFDSVEDGTESTDVTTLNVGGAFSLNAYLPYDAANQSIGVGYKSTALEGPLDTNTGKLDESGITFSYGRTLGANLLAGASVSVIDGSWKNGVWPSEPGTPAGDTALNNDLKYTGGEILLGGLMRASDTVTVGGVGSYATGRARAHTGIRENGDFNRYRLRGGVAWQAAEQTLLTGDLEYASAELKFDSIRGKSKSETTGIMGGVEQELLPEALVLRGGLYGKKEKFTSGTTEYETDYWGFTAGLGARIKAVDVNYTMDIRTTGDIGHIFGMQYDW